MECRIDSVCDEVGFVLFVVLTVAVMEAVIEAVIVLSRKCRLLCRHRSHDV